MQIENIKPFLKAALRVLSILPFAAVAAYGQAVNLTAGPATATLPDGSTVPMWGYSCTGVIAPATCAALNPAAAGNWSPVVITVPTGQVLTINLTNNLTFTPTGSTTANTVPTSLVIVGQLGGGLGGAPTSTPSPDHTNAQPLTWPIAADGPGQPLTGVGTPPAQGPRVQSFSTEVAAGATTALTFGTATNPLRPGTYLIESGTHPSIQGPMGLYGMLVVTTAPSGTTAGTAYPAVGTSAAVTYNAEVPLLLSEIDPVQNKTVSAAVSTAGFSETTVWSGLAGGCGNPASTTYLQCYPPAVNYTPLYYLFNGVAFSKTNTAASLFPVTPAPTTTGTVLVRFVNAGLRMHVPSIVGALTGTPAAGGFSLIAEDGNRLPGVPRVQSEVFLPAGKTYDVMINATATASALPVFDRQLSLSGNSIARDAGMLAYIGNGGTAPTAVTAVAKDDSYSVVAGKTLTVSDPAKGVIANDSYVYGVTLVGTVSGLALNADGTFTYTGPAPVSFKYCANGTVTGTTCSSGITATVHLNDCATVTGCLEAAGGITMNPITFTSNVATRLSIAPPGILAVDKDGAGYPLTVAAASVTPAAGLTLSVDPNGGFNATATAAGTYTFTYKAQNSQGTVSATSATVTLIFPAATGLTVTVMDGSDKTTVISDYRWIIEEDRTFYVDPNCTSNPPTAGCPTAAAGIVPTFGTNFHTSYMPVVASGCIGPAGAVACETGQTVFDPGTGQHVPAVCDIGNGVCRTDATQFTAVDPGQVHLDPTKRYYISVLPGDAANPFGAAYLGAPNCSTPGHCGHGMGGAPIAAGQTAVTIYTQPSPYPPSKLSVFVFEDDFPLNGEQDANGGIDVLATNEPGLGGFQITLFDDAGGTGDATGQPTYDMFNQPLSNSLAGTIDPATQLDACPVSKISRFASNQPTTTSPAGITGMIVTCPRFESDGLTLSPLAGQAVIANLYPGRYGVVATPNADRIARGEEWLQTNTLDGQKAHDSFLRIGEPNFFQEFGPAGYHVTIGFANPAIINARKAGVCGGTDPNLTALNCTHTVTGMVTTERMSRTPDERLYSSGDNSSFSFTQCYVSLGDTDGEDFAFTKCNGDGTFTLTGIPDGNWRITVFDQWNDMLVDGLSTPVGLGTGFTAASGMCTGPTTSTTTCDVGQIAMNQWQANIYTSTFFDNNGNGVFTDYSGRQCTGTNTPAGCNPNYGNQQPGLTLVPTNIRFRDGSYSNFNNTDLSGNAGFNEVFPLFSWYVIESDTTRFKTTGTHVVYDAGGPADGTPGGGTSLIAANLANTLEAISVPAVLRVPGARYCASADCKPGDTAGGSTGRVDPGIVHPYGSTYGWQGFSGQNSFLEFGKKPYAVGETGGIHGEVIYASTRPFDDPGLLIHTSWTPDVPGVTINLYQEGTAADGTQSLTLVDTTKTSSWDDWAQGFRSDGNPNMNCPGQGAATGTNADLFFFTLFNQPMYLDFYNNQHSGPPMHNIPNNSQYKCYDGMHNWNQLQPAPYDGMYQFPSITALNPTSGKPAGTNCTICVPNPDTTDAFRVGTPMLPAGKYVVEVVVPPGYELVKEEDKNILIGDNYIAPVTVQFPGLAGSVYILPDQAAIAATYNANNAQNSTVAFGRTSLPSHEGDTGSVETFWPCVGAARIVPDYISLFPGSLEVAPFAGAKRNLCDRKEVTLDDQTSALAKFWIFSSTHVAAHFTGVITDDFTSEFDPFSPQFGEKFSPANLPIAIKDWTGTEISRVYSDQWGTYNGLTYSTWEVNPPNPTGYAPTMMVTCMNDPGTGTTPDPLFNPQYSQFCYEIPFMPGQTQYMDTPVVPTSAFAGAGYNNPDCNYPASTPAIKEVDGDGNGPYISDVGTGHPITIHALGDVMVPNYGYSGPSATTLPYNQKTVMRHYGFGSSGTVTIGGVAATISSWTDQTIVVTLPNTGTPPPPQVPLCSKQQQAQYGGSSARCGQIVITRADNGLQSIDTVTMTIGGKAPTHVLSTGSIQSAIDAAAPGDLIIVDAGTHSELVQMWKPVRLQGVGAASSVINANTHPAGKLDTWRARINCLFGLALNGQPLSTPGNLVPAPGANIPGDPNFGKSEPLNLYDPSGASGCPATGWNYFNGGPNNPQVDRIPLEGIVGWDTTVNGNLAQLLQEPSLMGAFEGAGITVLAKGVRYPAGVEIFGTSHDNAAGSNVAHEGQFPESATQGTNLLTNRDADCNTLDPTKPTTGYTSNFLCNPSRIDGLSVTNSSQGGGGIFAHGWAHNLEIANNRVYNNTGTLTGGISIGQGESPDALVAGNNGDPLAGSGGFGGLDQQPWTCLPGAVLFDQSGSGITGNQQASLTGFADGQQLPFCYNVGVNVHHNYVTQNSSIGDEVFSGTPAGAGGVSICTGADYYKFQYNWVCGNLSTGDGGGVAHIGFIFNGDMEHNTILFNQSTNPTIPTNGGGLIVMGAAPDSNNAALGGAECGAVTDVDCAPGLSDGTGPGLVINANLIMGNAAESGSGGGVRFQDVNGTEVALFPNGSTPITGRNNIAAMYGGPGGTSNYPTRWNNILATNNIIVNNVAGWDGGGVSFQDALAVKFVNNTVVSNDSTASAGPLFNTLGAPVASAPGCTSNCTTSTTASAPQAAGLVSMRNTQPLIDTLPAGNGGTTGLTCPTGNGTAGSATASCRTFSVPLLSNDVIFQNRSFYIGVGSLGTGTLNQQHVVALYPGGAPQTPAGQAASQTFTGQCVAGSSYWDIGARGDTGPTNHNSGLTLAPTFSVLTSTTGYTSTGSNNRVGSTSTVVTEYCNGSRVPPEFQSSGYQVPPGISDATVPNPIFNLTPAATVDEGNNWINISWGPLSLTNPSTNVTLGNYTITNASPAYNNGTPTGAPTTDFFGTTRPQGGFFDVGAVEFVAGGSTALLNVTGGPLSFGNQAVGTTSAAQSLTLHNTGTAGATGITVAVTAPFARLAGSCGTTLAAGATCTITVNFTPTATGAASGSVTITANVGVSGSPVLLSGTGVAPVISATLTPTSHNYGTVTRTCPGTTIAQIAACAVDPAQIFTLTNTGNVTLTGIGNGVVGGTNATEYTFRPVLSTCGPAVGGQLVATTTLAPGASCVVTVQFQPKTAQTTGLKSATISVTDAAGTQTSTLTGTAN
jgi:hypothetical protein